MTFHFTIDKVLNKYIPKNQISKLPRILQIPLGYHSTSPVSDYWVWLEILIASFCGISLLEGVFKSHTVFTKHHAPMIIASYGATAILCFNSSQVPLAQPRNILFGHFISALIGVCIAKLFGLSKLLSENYWASGALSVGIASVLMSIFNCVHPPAGASALMPSIDEHVKQMSWWYLPVHIISSVLIIAVSLITGNIIRRYPVYWWYPSPQAQTPRPKSDDAQKETPASLEKENEGHAVIVNEGEIIIPKGILITEEETTLLENIKRKINSNKV